jgi:hypothetical protein
MSLQPVADLVKDLLWSGIEDFTGLWDAALTAQSAEGLPSLDMARDRVRSVLESLLAEGLVDLYEFRGLPRNDATPVAWERRFRLMRDDQFWAAPEDGDDVSVWYDTTEKGFELYCEHYNSGVRLYRR